MASASDEDDETFLEEKECRVCRCPASPTLPLFSPCLCSGSISSIHQPCLEQWLAHSKHDNCELCKFKFRFKPLYKEVIELLKHLQPSTRLLQTHCSQIKEKMLIAALKPVAALKKELEGLIFKVRPPPPQTPLRSPRATCAARARVPRLAHLLCPRRSPMCHPRRPYRSGRC